MLDILDAWTAAQPDPKPGRPEAIRRLVAKALADSTPMKSEEIAEKAEKAEKASVLVICKNSTSG